ncbi:hypothetical protein DFJ73DRAFT_126793 [Zopfochytrium polystomum]|nr:hypothetical protein DFJ73DRAFT_126793 [Zopfochytrium polystomum]
MATEVKAISILRFETRDQPTRHVAYQISVTGPVRGWTVWRRYSEFEALHQAWLQMFPHAPPPCNIPAKTFSLFGNATLNDPSKANERRIGLEKYLLSILQAQDDRWRSTKEWAVFLGLPSSDPSGKVSGGAAGSVQGQTETWMDDYRRLQADCRDIRGLIVQRDHHSSSGDVQRAQMMWLQAKKAHSNLHSKVMDLEQALKQLSHLPSPAQTAASPAPLSIGGLNLTSLLSIPSASAPTQIQSKGNPLSKAEIARREDLIANLKMEIDRIGQLLTGPKVADSSSSAKNDQRSGSLNSAVDTLLPSTAPSSSQSPRSGRRFGAAPPLETAQTKGLDNSQLVQLQRQTMDDQSEALSTLSTIVRRQYDVGVAIGAELDLHNRLLEELDDDVTRVGENLKSAGRKLDNVAKRR